MEASLRLESVLSSNTQIVDQESQKNFLYVGILGVQVLVQAN